MKDESKILYRIGGIPVREVNHVRLTLNEHEYKKLAQIAIDTKLSMSVIIALQGQPCSKCGNSDFVLTVPKNILSINKHQGGRSLLTRNSNEKHKQ